MGRCVHGIVLANAVDEVRDGVRNAIDVLLPPGRPRKQLDRIRKVLAEHDASCYEGCKPGEP